MGYNAIRIQDTGAFSEAQALRIAGVSVRCGYSARAQGNALVLDWTRHVPYTAVLFFGA